jgi:GntR family transcriptional regulator/MocR family aminotransferase
VHKAKYVTDWHTSMLAQAVLARFIDNGGFARHIRKIARVYAARHKMITSILAHDFADHLEVIPSAAGLHVAAVGRDASDGGISAVVRRASGYGVGIQELSRFAVEASPRPGLVVGYGAIPTARIEEGLRLLRSCFNSRPHDHPA